MNLEKKMVWDLSLEEIEYIYRHRHMNPYVYAALKTYHTSCPPLNRPVYLRPNTIPPYLRAITEKLLEFSPQIGHEDPSYVRAGITFYTYNLYTVLDQVQLEDVPLVVQLLSALAYLSICSEKNDKLPPWKYQPLWKYQVIRVKDKTSDAIIEKLLKPKVDFKRIAIMPPYGGEARDKHYYGDGAYMNVFMKNVMSSIIICMENGDDPLMIEVALLNAERAMRAYVQDFGLTLCENIQIVIRCYNTLYFYGGTFFEKQGQYDRAVEWYLKDIYEPALPGLFDSRDHLKVLKIITRLISAYHLISSDQPMKRDLKNLIDRSFINSFTIMAAYAHRVFEAFQLHPESDVRKSNLVEADNKSLLYAGETSRDVYFCSLLYNKFVLGTDYGDIDYTRFFEY